MGSLVAQGVDGIQAGGLAGRDRIPRPRWPRTKRPSAVFPSALLTVTEGVMPVGTALTGETKASGEVFFKETSNELVLVLLS